MPAPKRPLASAGPPARGDPHPLRRPPWSAELRCGYRSSFRRRILGVLLLLGSLPLACSEDRPVSPGEDTREPAAIQDLTAQPLDHRTLRLTWTAPGDDDSTGTAAAYDLRYSTEPFPTGGHWPSWYPTLDSLPEPSPAGTAQELTVPGLLPETRYYLGLRTCDEADNWSRRSNVAIGVTTMAPDSIPPAAITDLSRDAGVHTRLRLRWTAPADEGAVRQVVAYDIRFAYGPLNGETWETATRAADPPVPRPAGETEIFEVPDIEFARRFEIGIKSRDRAGNSSSLSNVVRTVVNAHRVFRIRPDGTGDAPTIQAGIDSAAVGDTVLVEPGRYYEVLRFGDRDIVVRGAGTAEETVIDGTGLGTSVVYFPEPLTRAALLQDLTVTGGVGSPDYSHESPQGGGIWIRRASPIIRRVRVVDNHVGGTFGTGGGIQVGADRTVWPLIEDCLIEGNSTTVMNGGGIAIENAGATVRRCRVVGNSCHSDGGGFWIWGGRMGPVEVIDCEITDNSAGDHGGGIYLAAYGFSEPAVVQGNLLARNQALGAGVGETGTGGGLAILRSRGAITHNTVVDNFASGEVVCTGGGILLYRIVEPGLRLSHNIIAGNQGCGLSCRREAGAEFGPNLFWANDIDIGDTPEDCPAAWAAWQIFAAPLFCGPEMGDYRVRPGSPAVTGEGVMGAFPIPGCLP